MSFLSSPKSNSHMLSTFFFKLLVAFVILVNVFVFLVFLYQVTWIFYVFLYQVVSVFCQLFSQLNDGQMGPLDGGQVVHFVLKAVFSTLFQMKAVFDLGREGWEVVGSGGVK